MSSEAVPGTGQRLGPILMTAITTLVGVVPSAVQHPALAGMSYYSMALVIVGGWWCRRSLTTLLLPTADIMVGVWSWVRPPVPDVPQLSITWGVSEPSAGDYTIRQGAWQRGRPSLVDSAWRPRRVW